MRFRSALLAVVLGAAPLAAQVGHSPSASPYREITGPTALTVLVGRFSSNGGRYGLGPNDGLTYGVRYSFRANKFLEFSMGLTRGDLQRLQLDPFVPTAERQSGPFKNRVTITEIGLTGNLTGGKTWKRLAPFVGIAGGATLQDGFRSPNDTTGFRIGTQFTFTPHAGTRIFVSDKLHLRLEAKAVFWRVRYPTSFTLAPADDPVGTPIVTDGRLREWITNGMLQVGLGYSVGLL